MFADSRLLVNIFRRGNAGPFLYFFKSGRPIKKSAFRQSMQKSITNKQ